MTALMSSVRGRDVAAMAALLACLALCGCRTVSEASNTPQGKSRVVTDWAWPKPFSCDGKPAVEPVR